MAEGAKESEPLDRNQRADTDRMQHRAEKRLTKARRADNTREVCGKSGDDSERQHKRRFGHREHKEGEYLTAEQEQRCRKDELR